MNIEYISENEYEHCSHLSSYADESAESTFPEVLESRIDVSNQNNGDLPEYLRYEAEIDLHEKYEWINRDVEALRDMVLGETNLKSKIDRSFLLIFLRARKFDYDRAFNMIQKYYHSHQQNQDIYNNLLPSALSSFWPRKMQTVLTKPDYNGRTILLFSTQYWNAEEVKLDDILRAQILILEHIVRVPITQLKGVSAVVNCKGLSINHYFSPNHIKRMISIIQEVFPLRFKALHFINEPSIFEWIFSLIKPFLSDTIKGRLHFHGDNVTNLHNHISPDILPEEFGGSAGPLDNAELVDRLHEQEDYFKDHFSYGYTKQDIHPCDTSETSLSASVFESVSGMGSFLGNYYRRMCID